MMGVIPSMLCVILLLSLLNVVLSAPPTPPSGKQWNLEWFDEFSGSSLNSSKWSTKQW